MAAHSTAKSKGEQVPSLFTLYDNPQKPLIIFTTKHTYKTYRSIKTRKMVTKWRGHTMPEIWDLLRMVLQLSLTVTGQRKERENIVKCQRMVEITSNEKKESRREP